MHDTSRGHVLISPHHWLNYHGKIARLRTFWFLLVHCIVIKEQLIVGKKYMNKILGIHIQKSGENYRKINDKRQCFL